MLMTYWSKLRSNDEVFRNWNDEIPICGSCIVFPFFLPRCSLTFGKVGPLLRPALCVCDLNPALIHKTRAYIRQSHRIFSMIFHQKTSRVGYLLFFFQSQFLRNSGVRVLVSLRVTSGTSFPWVPWRSHEIPIFCRMHCVKLNFSKSTCLASLAVVFYEGNATKRWFGFVLRPYSNLPPMTRTLQRPSSASSTPWVGCQLCNIFLVRITESAWWVNLF